jgi:hypothetical protein
MLEDDHFDRPINKIFVCTQQQYVHIVKKVLFDIVHRLFEVWVMETILMCLN